ncbi:MAG: lysine--tRNA ligase [Patescibacteria group bacterium]
MATRFEEIQKSRLEKLAKLKDLGINPYPSRLVKEPQDISSALKEKEGSAVTVAGRITRWREHGNSIFSDIKDESGKFQIFLQKKNLGEQFKVTKLFDVGDFLLVSGKVFKTQAGETTVDVENFQLLSKSIRPLPDDWYGLKDIEERHRKRYLDLLINGDLKDIFRKKAIFWQSMRNFMIDKGFLEVETPVLEVTAGGADANPFVTHHDALDVNLYLRISMGELWQKRLMVAGFERTFEIGRQFRNEGLSREHLQDYSQMEFYWAYANYEDSMKLVEELYKYVAKQTFGKTEFSIGGHEVDLGSEWGRIDYVETIKNHTGVDITKVDIEELKTKLKELKAEFDKSDTKARLIDTLWKQVRKQISGPVFLTGHPVEISPLAKRMEEKPDFVERYQIIIAGSEMGNGYSELNDPKDQSERFMGQQKMRDEGDLEAQMLDRDFVEALEYGMPPTTGFGVSERLFSFLVDMPIKEAVLFPLMRPEK